MLLGSGLGAVALVAFLVFAVTGLIWLVITLQQADPAVTRRNTAMIALVSGAVLIAVLLAQALFLQQRPNRDQRIARLVERNHPGLMRPSFGGGGLGLPGGRFAPRPPHDPASGPGVPRVRPFRPNAPAQPAPTAQPSVTP